MSFDPFRRFYLKHSTREEGSTFALVEVVVEVLLMVLGSFLPHLLVFSLDLCIRLGLITFHFLSKPCLILITHNYTLKSKITPNIN